MRCVGLLMLWSKVPRPIFNTVWIFAYGSLIFRPGFSFLRQVPGHVDGFVRRFWQGSPDHRGTAENPGRVVTLVDEVGGRCEGMAFEIAEKDVSEILAYLDERESGGYARREINVKLNQGEMVQALTWIAPASNSNFLGDVSEDAMLAQILSACGQSGANRDYVLKLAQELERIGVRDVHVERLAKLVREAST